MRMNDAHLLLQALIAVAIGVGISPVIAVASARLSRDRRLLSVPARAWLALACGAAAAAVATLGGPWTMTLYGVFLAAAVTAAAVDQAERRIPDRLTYPLMIGAVLVVPWLDRPVTWWSFLAPPIGGAVAFFWAFVWALVADQGLGDVKLSAAIGAWLGHFGVLAVALGVVLGQTAVVVAVLVARRNRQVTPSGYAALGPALVSGAVIAVALTGLTG